MVTAEQLAPFLAGHRSFTRVETMLIAPAFGASLLKLTRVPLLSTFAFKLTLRPYKEERDSENPEDESFMLPALTRFQAGAVFRISARPTLNLPLLALLCASV